MVAEILAKEKEQEMTKDKEQEMAKETVLNPLPVLGYTPQLVAAVEVVNENKRLEESVLCRMDELQALDGIDRRWLAIARTHIEQGFMAANRAVFKPTRLGMATDRS